MTAPVKELIRVKRDGGALAAEELTALARGLADGTVSDAQGAAFAMAVLFRGMATPELAAWTAAMRDSGATLDWSHEDRPVLDKHSTGGVGDKVSLVLAPLLAACGAAVPMLSGRGLGHTGGTLDKLDAIPGYDSTPDAATIRRVVADAGCVIAGQTAELAPADRRLYAIRDATATVESIPLIVSSILSKKLAAGLEGLVLDVKHGSGAFVAELEGARALARALVDAGTAAGLPTSALLTDMDRVLGRTAGNALEVAEAIATLTDPTAADARLVELTLALARRVLPEGSDPERALESGAAAERFAAMAAALGGPADLLERPRDHRPVAPVRRAVAPDDPGVVTAHRTRDLGLAVLLLGGGRRAEGDAIDPRVGLADIAAPGTRVDASTPLCVVHARDEASADAAASAVRRAVAVGDAAPPDPPVVTEEVRP